MKAYKIELLVIDHEQLGEDEIKSMLENMRWLFASVMRATERDIGEWHDDHPLNCFGTMARAYQDIFGESK